MNYNPKINLDRFEASFKAIDAHTAGEFCRIVYSGFPKPEGNTPIERKHWLEKNYNHYRTALMLEPRGHHDMFGAYICEPIDPQADFAVFFMDTGGWLNMCGHCTIGAVTVAVETGMVEAKEPYTEVVLEAPAGIIRTKAEVKDGKVLDTSMGFTPLAGIEMGTRCGDIDPAIVPYIMNKTGMNADEMNEYMNKKCGFLGVSGISSDCRDVSAAAKAGNKRAKLALDIVSYQIRKFIGAYTAAMGGLDAIVFTAGIGENDWEMRESVCSELGYFGVEFDAEHNANLPRPLTATEISKPTSKVKVFMIPTNEELVIASDTERIVKAL